MINLLKKIFQQSEDKLNDSNLDGDLHLLCGLMIEAANVDGEIDKNELDKISKSLVQVFNENSIAVEIEIKKCINELNEDKSLHFYTSKINKTFSDDKKVSLIEILWEIILEDGETHDFESNLIRRLAGLLYISDFECGKAKKKALDKIQDIG